jgi:hypothetical protein
VKGGDGRAALCCWPVEVMLPGARFRIAARPAIDWILKVADEDWLAIVPGMVEGDEIDQLIDDKRVSPVALVAAGRDATTTAAGMPWWSACRLVGVTLGDVEMAGALTLAGVDPGRVSLGAYVMATYRILVVELDKKRRASLDADITRVPKGVATSELYDPQAAAASFERAYARQQGGQRR